MIRLPEWAGEEIEKIADRKGLHFATVIREMICEQLNSPAMRYKDTMIAAYILKGLQNMHVYVFVFADSNIEFLLITYFLYHVFRLFIL